MTFASNFTRGLTLGALAMGLTLSGANAQNGSNYHVLSNGLDVIYGGVGAGGGQTKADGIGTWIAGEDLKGSHQTQLGDWGYRFIKFRESMCVLNAPVSGPLQLQMRGIVFIEMDGGNGNDQSVFTDPACPTSTPSFPLGGSIGFIPYGVPAGTSASFGIAALPAGVGPTASAAILLPTPVAGTGTATIIGAASNVFLGINSTGYCWGVQFTWLPSAVPLLDDVDGMWHYLINGDQNNQYWSFSTDEMNVWQSNTLNTDGGLTTLVAGPANSDYEFLIASVEPNTLAALAPRGSNLTGSYYTQTENVANTADVVVNPNGGFDVGRGSAAISFSGTAGVPNPNTGVGNQNAANNPGTVVTLGFATWDNGGDFDGSTRLTWVSIDFLGAAGINPDLDPGAAKFGGQIRIPVVTAGLTQPITLGAFSVFGHKTSAAPSNWPDPQGFASGAFNVPAIAGASWQFPTGPQPAACAGVAVNLTYGTSGRVSPTGGLTWDPSIADTSGTKQLFLFN